MDNFMRTNIESDKLFHRTLIGTATAAIVFVIFVLQTAQVWFLYYLVQAFKILNMNLRPGSSVW